MGAFIAVAIETSHGDLISPLQAYRFMVLFPINLEMLCTYREAFCVSAAKDDRTDEYSWKSIFVYNSGKASANDKQYFSLHLLASHAVEPLGIGGHERRPWRLGSGGKHQIVASLRPPLMLATVAFAEDPRAVKLPFASLSCITRQ